MVSVNGLPPARLGERPEFAKLGAVHPSRPLRLETPQASSPRTAEIQRVVDLICPLGFGQRALIVSPPKAGKTVMLQAVAEGVALNHPAAILLILLVDERPEEVSEMVDWGRGEVIASSFDLSHERHVAVADMAFEHARRQVELGKDVVIVLDSLTRLARSHNTTGRGSGRTMSGGLDANALAKPKGLFGAARAVPEGGSLTVIATALIETESRMDDVIFEEFKAVSRAGGPPPVPGGGCGRKRHTARGAACRPPDGGGQTAAPAGPGRAPAGEGDGRPAGTAAARQDERRVARRRQLVVSFRRRRSACSCRGSSGVAAECSRRPAPDGTRAVRTAPPSRRRSCPGNRSPGGSPDATRS